MRRLFRIFLGCCLGLILGLATGSAQRKVPHYPQPPSPSQHPVGVDQDAKPQEPKPRMNLVEMERESRELSELAATIPGDVDLLKKGLLPKDVLDKLKRIEKLSKHLRGEVVF